MGAAYIIPFKSLNIMWNGSKTSLNYRAILMLLSIDGYDIIILYFFTRSKTLGFRINSNCCSDQRDFKFLMP